MLLFFMTFTIFHINSQYLREYITPIFFLLIPVSFFIILLLFFLSAVLLKLALRLMCHLYLHYIVTEIEFKVDIPLIIILNSILAIYLFIFILSWLIFAILSDMIFLFFFFLLFLKKLFLHDKTCGYILHCVATHFYFLYYKIFNKTL